MYNWFQAALPHFITAAQENSNSTLGPALGFKNPAACTRFFDQFLPDRPHSMDTCTYLASLGLEKAEVLEVVTGDQIGSDQLDEINERLDHIESRLDVTVSDKTLLLPPVFFQDMDHKQQYKYLKEFCIMHQIPYDDRDPASKDFHWLFKRIQRQFDVE